MDKEKDMILMDEEEDGKNTEVEEAEDEKSFCEKLKESIHEEMADSGKYEHMARWAEEEYPDSGYGFILRCIASEEQRHLEFLQKILFEIKGSEKK